MIKQIKAILRQAYPNAIIRVSETEYTYLHLDSSFFGKRTLPAFAVEVRSKDFHISPRSGKRIYHHPDWSDVTEVLRKAGLCAETPINGIRVINAPREQWPVGQYLGKWHTQPEQCSS